jgi:hypothetical protein
MCDMCVFTCFYKRKDCPFLPVGVRLHSNVKTGNFSKIAKVLAIK